MELQAVCGKATLSGGRSPTIRRMETLHSRPNQSGLAYLSYKCANLRRLRVRRILVGYL
jgi:hypothetical protein